MRSVQLHNDSIRGIMTAILQPDFANTPLPGACPPMRPHLATFVLTLLCCATGVTGNVNAQAPTAAERATISAALSTLQQSLAGIDESSRSRQWKPDAEIYAKAAEWILRHDEFYKPRYVQDTLDALQTGSRRAAELKDNSDRRRPSWLGQTGTVILAYRSTVDGSIQPYALTIPHGIDPRSPQRWPLHVKLHGRGGTLNEVSFIQQHDGKELPEGQDWIQIDVFGRTNNAYRWSGETDLFEAIADVQRRFRIDEERITLWGFSMGGAGAWHLGLHHPSRWSSVGAGAGFVDFYGYQNVNEPLPDWQHKTLHIYDAKDYALNAFDVPFITYGGELDKQLASSLTMQAATQPLDVPLTALVGPGMGHKFDDASFEKFMAFHKEHSAAGRPRFPGRENIRFITWTPKYNRCEWLTVEEMAEPYATTTASGGINPEGVLELETDNITALRLARVADEVVIDGQGPFDLRAAAGERLPEVVFVNEQDQWDVLNYDESLAFAENPERHKRHDLQGPIDDAFMESFVCVGGTGPAWSEPHQKWADWTLSRFEREFDKWFRGKVPKIDDTDRTDDDIANRNLILFGDPGSNAVLARILPDLPLQWTREQITIGGRTYDPRTHGVALVFPNPLNPSRYVVLNSGHTMHEKDFQSSNAWLFPKLGDVAILRFAPTSSGGFTEETVWADLFDSRWNLPDAESN